MTNMPETIHIYRGNDNFLHTDEKCLQTQFETEAYAHKAKLIEWLEHQRKATGLISEDLHDRNCVYNKAINTVIQHLKEQG